MLSDAYGRLQRGFGLQLNIPTGAEASVAEGNAADPLLDLASAFSPAGRGIGPDLRPRTRAAVDPYGPFGDDALAEAPGTPSDPIADFLRPLEEEWLGIHPTTKDDWLNRLLGRFTPGGACGTLFFGLSGAAGYIVGGSEGFGVYHDVSCATCPADWTRNWYLYETKGGRGGPWAGGGGAIDVGYSRHAPFLGTSHGFGGEVEFIVGVSGTVNVDPNAQPLWGLSSVHVTGWQVSGNVGAGAGGFAHLTQTSRIPYSRIQPYITAPQRAWQWATGP